MKKLLLVMIAVVSVTLLTACTEETSPCGEGTELQGDVCVLIEEEPEEVTCGEGTSLVDGQCVADENTNVCDESEVLMDGECVVLADLIEDLVGDISPSGPQVCTNETGLHTVPGGKMYTISSWLNWTFIGGHVVRDPDNAWIQAFGAAVFDVHTVPANAWEGSFTQSGMFLTKGCEYTFEFTLRTEAPNLKQDVIVFGETTSGESFFETTVPLLESSKTYRFTVTPTSSDYVSLGVYFANSTGMVIIEEIQITRDPIGTNE